MPKYPYRNLGAKMDRLFRNNANDNFIDIESDLKEQKTRVDNLITGTPQPSEVVDSRGGFPVLRDRLASVDSQLAQNVTNINDLLGILKGSPTGNNVSQLVIHATKGDKANLVQGSLNNPDSTSKNPLLWVQKFTKQDTEGDRFAHQVGGGFFEVFKKGSGVAGTQNVENTWIAVLASAIQESTNLGTPTAQDWDAEGNIIGLAGFAEAKGYPNGIITALWAYASSPELDDTTFDNLPSGGSFTTTGFEINLNLRHKDVGVKDVVSGHGTSVGQYIFNYKTPGLGVRDWTFALALNGNPDDSNYLGTDVSKWNGFKTGILIDKIKNRGILFGKYFAPNSYGIQFPDIVHGDLKAGIYMGNTKLNIGKYTGAIFNGRDMWVYDGAATNDKDNIKYRRGNVNESMFGSRGVAAVTTFTQSHRVIVRIDGNEYAIPLQFLNAV
jgi:hypothetical protein